MNVKLYINKELVDLIESDLDFNITKSITDFTDPSIRNGSYSYSIKIPTTSNNIRTFKFISLLNAINKFNKIKNYDCQLYADDNILIDGIFIMTEITELNFIGFITNKFKGDIISLLGSKSFRDLQLPQIDFEGTLLTYSVAGTHGNNSYESGTNMLNANLGFDFLALTNAYKNSTNGLLGSTIDYRDYYSTPLLAYSNFYTDKAINQLNVVTNNFSIDNFKPSIKLNVVLKQIFKDIGYNLEIQNELVNDTNILLPFFGDFPEWNWKFLSQTSVYTDNTVIQATARFTSNVSGSYHINQYTVRPFISSQQNSNRVQTLNSSLYNIFTDERNLGTLSINNSDTYQYGALNNDNNNICKVHFTPTNGLKYDHLNNFSILAPAPKDGNNTGWLYSVPADGIYEFETEISHHIRTYNYTRFGQYSIKNLVEVPEIDNLGQFYEYFPNLYMYDREKQLSGNVLGYDGKIEANKTWTYNSQEKWHMMNMIVFVKENEFDVESFTQNYSNQFIFPVSDAQIVQNNKAKGNIQFLRTGRKLKNFNESSIVAYYNPMLRDLYTGNHNQIWEDYINTENSIMKHANVIPTDWNDENEVIKYQGFNSETQILNYDNQITYDPANIPTPNNGNGRPLSPIGNEKAYNDKYSVAEQLKRKLVRLKRKNQYVEEKDFQYWDDYLLFASNPSNITPLISQADAQGLVKFKFQTTLKRGEQIRMYYVTYQQFKQAYKAKPYWVRVGNSPGLVVGANFTDENNPAGPTPGHGLSLNRMNYNDAYFDDMVVNKYSIKCVSENYSNKLKLANFLPDISQSTFLVDFIKSNNIYFNINENNVVMKSRGDFYSNKIQKDFTNLITLDTFSLTPVKQNKTQIYGTKPDANDDFKDTINILNPTLTVDLGNNIYLNQTTVDLTSSVLSSSYDRSYLLRRYKIDWNTNGAFRLLTTYIEDTILIPSFIENGDSKISLQESNANYDRTPRLTYFNGEYDLEDTSGKLNLINTLPFFHLDLKSSLSTVEFLSNNAKYKLYVDKFTDLSNASILTIKAFIDSNVFSQIDLMKPISIDSSLYYIQTVNAYNPISIDLTQIILLKV